MLHLIGVALVWGMIWAIICLAGTMWDRVAKRDIAQEVERQLRGRQ